MSTCDHHRTCGDCFSPSKVRDLELSARFLANQLAEATEWNLATFEELLMLKSSSKHRIDRQKRIVVQMLTALALEYTHVFLAHTKIPRVRQILGAEAAAENMGATFDAWLAARK